MSINFTLSNGIATGQPNCNILSRSKATKYLQQQFGGFSPIGNINKGGYESTGIQEIIFSNENKLLPGEYFYLLPCGHISTIVNFNMIIDNIVNPANGLGVGTQFSIGIASIDYNQSSMLRSANSNYTNIDNEALPVFIEQLDSVGAPLNSFNTQNDYFLSNTSGVPSPTNKLKYTMFDFNNMYGFEPSKLGYGKDIVCLYNSGTVAITEGRLKFNLQHI